MTGKTLRCEMTNGCFPDFTENLPLVYEVRIIGSNVERVDLSNHTLSLVVNATSRLIATVNPNDATNKDVFWESQNIDIATVNDSGFVTAKAIGETYIMVATEDGYFRDSCLVTVEKGLDIAAVGAENFLLKVYPNPASKLLIVENSGSLVENSTIEIFTSSGQLIGAYPSTGLKTEIDILHFPKGIYFVKLGNEVVKMIKK